MLQQHNSDTLGMVLKTMAVLLGLVFVCGVSFCLGALYGNGQAARSQWGNERDAVLPVLASDPAFADVRVSSANDGGWILLEGEVPRDVDKPRLMREVARAIGQRRAEHAVPGVRV